ncbi:hypothetical protein HII36_29790 [Nonomuraea sp. NN258]|nr:hypothetical protein [Nonomuraea antri]NRQ35993.1 hypothetical protein [Nonomuraea antri]
MSPDEAIENAARVLRNAEGETNLATMERLNELADTWLAMGALLLQRDRA